MLPPTYIRDAHRGVKLVNYRVVTFLLLWFALFAASGEAQSHLDFPRVLTPQEMATTGFAFVNTSSAQVNASFTFYGVDGAIQGQGSLAVPARGQVARLGSE